MTRRIPRTRKPSRFAGLDRAARLQAIEALWARAWDQQERTAEREGIPPLDVPPFNGQCPRN